MIHKDLDVWKLSMQLAKDVYKYTDAMPVKEMYGLTSQIRRSVVSIPSNIAEGAARKGTKEFVHFLYIALGSIAELETQLILVDELELLSPNVELENKLQTIRKKLVNLIKSVSDKGLRRHASDGCCHVPEGNTSRLRSEHRHATERSCQLSQIMSNI